VPVRPHVVVVGSGFGGLNAAKRLAGAAVDVTVVDRDNYHGFWPLLYQVATAGLAPDDIAYPIRSVYADHPNIRFRMGTVSGIDVEQRTLEIDGEPALAYDYLIVAAGTSTSDFGIPGVDEHAFPMKTVPDAMRLRNHVLTSFERADAESGAPEDGALTIVLVGGGPTGVELSGALSELIGHNLASDFRHLDMTRARLVLVEMSDHLLPGFSPPSQEAALSTLKAKGVEVRFGAKLVKVTGDGVTFEDGSSLAAKTVIWTAGVRANPVAALIPGEKGRSGTPAARPDLSLPDHPEVFVIGDLCGAPGRHGQPLPQLAQVAIQGGRHAAGNITRRIAGKATRPFRYRNHGIMATIGRRDAVAELPGGIHFRGPIGWFMWLVVHLMFLVGFRNRVVVMVNWAWNYVSWDRASRVIIGEDSTTATGQHRA
jgi:NADH dehydrogenase